MIGNHWQKFSSAGDAFCFLSDSYFLVCSHSHPICSDPDHRIWNRDFHNFHKINLTFSLYKMPLCLAMFCYTPCPIVNTQAIDIQDLVPQTSISSVSQYISIHTLTMSIHMTECRSRVRIGLHSTSNAAVWDRMGLH